METLIHNPVAEMYGPYFLILYGAFIFIAFAIGQLFWSEPKTDRPLLQVPTQPDPYEIAYLQGGTSYVLELVCFSLLQRGYWEVRDEAMVRRVDAPSPASLNELERTVFSSLENPRSISEIREDRKLKAAIINRYRQFALEEQLLYSQTRKFGTLFFGAGAIVFLLGLAAYKIFAALANGYHNIGYLTLMAMGSLFLFAYPYYRCHRPTSRGQNYLNLLKNAFYTVSVSEEEPEHSKLAIALFGSAKLVNTPYRSYSFLFQVGYSYHPAASRSSSSSCGSGGGCGTSCGGCGGCGGGGCGG